MAGFACGVKITAVPMLLIAIAVAVVVTKKFRPAAMKQAIIFVATGAIIFSPWLIRNQIWAHNPIFPLGMKMLSQAHFTDGQVDRFIQAHSPPAAERSIFVRLKIVWTDIIAHWQYGYVLIPYGHRRDRASAKRFCDVVRSHRRRNHLRHLDRFHASAPAVFGDADPGDGNSDRENKLVALLGPSRWRC